MTIVIHPLRSNMWPRELFSRAVALGEDQYLEVIKLQEQSDFARVLCQGPSMPLAILSGRAEVPFLLHWEPLLVICLAWMLSTWTK